MKKPVTSWQKVSRSALPIWDKQTVAGFGSKFASPLVLMESPEWARFSGEHRIEWDARHIHPISAVADPSTAEQHTTPPGIPTKALIDYAQKSADYFHSYACTTNLYAAKSCVTLRSKNSKFTIGTVWSIF